MAMDRQLLQDAVDQATANYNTYASTYREIREKAQEEYDGKWKEQIIKDYAREADIKESSARRQINRYEAYITGSGRQARNPDRPVGTTREAFREIGRTLEPIKKDAPPDGLRFTVDMKVGRDSEHSSARTRNDIDIYMDYNTAVQFIQNPNYHDLFDAWFDDGGEAYGEDGDYEADVTAVSAA